VSRSERGAAGQPQRICISRVARWQQIRLLLAAEHHGTVHECERIIARGRVAVNGRIVRDSKARARPGRDVLTLDGTWLRLECYCRYVAFHKPYEVMSTFTDRHGRATLKDYVPVEGIYAAGRLDYESEGLLLLTDDGWLIHRLTQPGFDHPKTYLVQVERIPDDEALNRLREGVEIQGYRTQPAEVELLTGEREPRVRQRSKPIRYRKSVPTAWLRITLREGRNRQVRRMTAAVGHPTLRLIRVAIGPLELGDLPVGEWREVTEQELDAFARALRSAGPAMRYPRR